MAELILTDEEKAAPLWSDLDDAALGKLVKKKISLIADVAKQLDRTTIEAAALMLCLYAVEHGAAEFNTSMEGVTHDGREIGDWRVSATRVAAPAAA